MPQSKMSADDMFDRFAGEQMCMADMLDYTPVSLASDFEEMHGKFTRKLQDETGYYTWAQIAGAIIEHAAHVCA